MVVKYYMQNPINSIVNHSARIVYIKDMGVRGHWWMEINTVEGIDVEKSHI